MGVKIYFELNYRAVHIDLGKSNIKKVVELVVHVNRDDGDKYVWSKNKFIQRY